MIVTLQTKIDLKPQVSVHGDMIKCDLGALLLEFEAKTFKDFVDEVIRQADDQGLVL
jgi:hypothetical protein